MAQTATIYRLHVQLSDVDRGVYELLDLRVARHPSESMKYLLTRVVAYALSYEDGIAFSKGGLSAADEPPISVHDRTGVLVSWIDVGAPSADRLHKAAKAARTVSVFTADIAGLRREASARAIHRANEIAVWKLQPAFLTALEEKLDRTTKLELVRTEEQLYLTVGGSSIEGTIERVTLASEA